MTKIEPYYKIKPITKVSQSNNNLYRDTQQQFPDYQKRAQVTHYQEENKIDFFA